jgi:Arc/MetJ-type ribon-helix-helix transcriptional regulator
MVSNRTGLGGFITSSRRQKHHLFDIRWCLMQVQAMAHTLTGPQQRLIKELLTLGRWNNESEVLRYGLHLVAKEVEADQARNLQPYPAGILARAYRRLRRSEKQEWAGMERASAGPQPGELE